MAYPTRLNEKHLRIMDDILPQMQSLKEGASLYLSYQSPQFTETVRQTIYTWLFLENQKALFRLKKVSSTELILQRLVHEEPKIHTTQGVVEDFVIEHLILLDNEDDVQARLQHTETLTPEQKVRALEEWKRHQ